MISRVNFAKPLMALAIMGFSLLAPAADLISVDAANAIRSYNPREVGAKGKQLAMLQSYLYTQPVTIGVEGREPDDRRMNAIQRGIETWQDVLPDCPFQLAQPGQKPMIVVKFVNYISAGGDVQGQIDATRALHWGRSVSYKVEGTLQVRINTGRRGLNEDELTEVVAHELGHLLGLDDNEELVGLMGPFVPGRPRLEPSREEVDAVVGYREQLRQAIAKLGNR